MAAIQPRAARRWFTPAKGILALAAILALPDVGQGAEEIKVRHILVRKREQAEAALDELVNAGISRNRFIDVARKHSMDAVTKGAGGDLGWNTRKKFVPEFAEVAFNLEPGQVSEPVRTRFGWHLIFVEEKRETRSRAGTQKPAPSPVTPNNPSQNSPDSLTPGDRPTPGEAEETAEATTTTEESTTDEGTDDSGTATEVEEKQPPVAKQETVADRNVTPSTYIPQKLLLADLEVKAASVPPSRAIELSITLRNEGKESVKLPHPSLLGLGLSVRSDATPSSPPLDVQQVEEPESFLVDLPGRSAIGKIVLLHEYFPDLPVNARSWVTWDGSKLIERFNERFPGQSAKVAGFEEARTALTAPRSQMRVTVSGIYERFNRVSVPTLSSEVPIAIFDPVTSAKKYYAKMSIRGESSPLWFEMFARDQLEGVRHFARLANSGFYDGLQFFDIRPGSYIRGGCPRNDGTGAPPSRMQTLSNRANLSHEKGTLSFVTRLASGGAGREAGSIFFVSLADHPQWDDDHVPIGRLIQGEEALDRLVKRNYISIDQISVVPAERAPSTITGLAAAEADASDAGDGASDDVPITTGLPKVRLETSKGNITVELFQDDARNTVSNFISLIEGGEYEPEGGLKILQRADGYFLRTGSPDNTNTGGPGYRIANETANNEKPHKRGTLSMCLQVNPETNRPLPDTAGSQFMILLDDIPFYNGMYTPFGRVVDGLDVIDKLAEGDVIQDFEILTKRSGQYNPRTTPIR